MPASSSSSRRAVRSSSPSSFEVDPPGNTHAPPMNFCSGLRCTSSTSGPSEESRSRISEAASRASVTSPVFSSSPGGGSSTRIAERTKPSALDSAAVTRGDATVQQWICTRCGFIYDPEQGDPDGGIPPGTAFEDIPDDWFCPVCGARKKDFEPHEA